MCVCVCGRRRTDLSDWSTTAVCVHTIISYPTTAAASCLAGGFQAWRGRYEDREDNDGWASASRCTGAGAGTAGHICCSSPHNPTRRPAAGKNPLVLRSTTKAEHSGRVNAASLFSSALLVHSEHKHVSGDFVMQSG